MSTSKAALKAISTAVKAQKYDEVVRESQNLLASDPKSYQGFVFPFGRPSTLGQDRLSVQELQKSVANESPETSF